MAVTANTIIDAAYRKIRIKSPSGRNDADALEALNDMISTWGISFLAPFIVRENFDLIVGQASYTIGSGGDFDTVRPLSLSNCHLRDSNNYSYIVKPFAAKDYNKISSKTLEGRPDRVYLAPGYSLSTLLFNREADQAYDVYFEFWKNFTEFASLTTTFSFPNEYKEAMIYNLAIKLAEDTAVEIPITVRETAMTTKSLISKMNAVNHIPPKANFDFNTGCFFNIKIDE